MKCFIKIILLVNMFFLFTKVYAGTLNVESKGVSETSGFCGGNIQRKNIESITFTNTNTVPNDALGSYDGSKEKDKSITIWYTDTNNNNLYELYVGSTNGVSAPSNTENLFKGFTNVNKIDLSYLDMSSVSDINKTFLNLSKLNIIIVKKSNIIYNRNFNSSVNDKYIIIDDGIDSSWVSGIKNKNNDDKTGIITTGDYFGNNKIVVLGDINTSGEITPLSYVRIKNHIMKSSIITDPLLLLAADYDLNDKITPLDYVKVKNYIMSKNNGKSSNGWNINKNYGTGSWVHYSKNSDELKKYYSGSLTLLPFSEYVPEKAKSSGDSLPLIIWLHGLGEVGCSDANFEKSGLIKVINDWSTYNLKNIPAIIIAPRLISGMKSWTSFEEPWVSIKAIVMYAKEKYKINTNKVILIGHSLGGSGVENVNKNSQDLFSALIVLSGYWSSPANDNIEFYKNIAMKGYSEVQDNAEPPIKTGEKMKDFFSTVNHYSDVTIYKNDSHGQIPRLALTEDKNNDGVSDLIYWALSQNKK